MGKVSILILLVITLLLYIFHNIFYKKYDYVLCAKFPEKYGDQVRYDSFILYSYLQGKKNDLHNKIYEGTKDEIIKYLDQKCINLHPNIEIDLSGIYYSRIALARSNQEKQYNLTKQRKILYNKIKNIELFDHLYDPGDHAHD